MAHDYSGPIGFIYLAEDGHETFPVNERTGVLRLCGKIESCLMQILEGLFLAQSFPASGINEKVIGNLVEEGTKILDLCSSGKVFPGS